MDMVILKLVGLWLFFCGLLISLHHSKGMEKFDPTTWGTVGQWIAAVATFTVAGLALFKEEIIRRFRHPDLNVSINPGPPDCHKTTVYFQKDSKLRSTGRYYLRLWVTNQGSVRAKKAQVFAAKIEKKGSDGLFTEVARFLPMNLRWSQTGDNVRPEISPMEYRRKWGSIVTSVISLLYFGEANWANRYRK